MKPNPQFPSVPRVSVIIVGYLIAAFGAFSFLSVPLFVSLLIFVGGVCVTALASRRDYSPPPFTWRKWLVFVAGGMVILGVLWLFGEDRVRQWTPHPIGYAVEWLLVLSMFWHLRHIFHHKA